MRGWKNVLRKTITPTPPHAVFRPRRVLSHGPLCALRSAETAAFAALLAEVRRDSSGAWLSSAPTVDGPLRAHLSTKRQQTELHIPRQFARSWSSPRRRSRAATRLQPIDATTATAVRRRRHRAAPVCLGPSTPTGLYSRRKHHTRSAQRTSSTPDLKKVPTCSA